MYKNILMYLLLSTLTLGLVSSCSSDDDEILVVETPELALDIEGNEVRVSVGEATTVDILSGAGEYRAFSANPDLVSVEVSGSTLNITGHDLGSADIIIADKENQYLSVIAISMFQEVVLESDLVELYCRLGWNGETTLGVHGNGGYTFTLEEESSLRVTLPDKHTIRISATPKDESFSERVIVTDKHGIEASFEVVVDVTTDPFSEEQLEEIMSQENEIYSYNDESNRYGNDAIKEVDGDTYEYGWQYYNYYYLYRVTFGGGLDVGEKTGGKFEYKMGWTSAEYELEKCEIIKNDGEKIWCIFSAIKDNKLHYGYFITTIE